MQNKQNKTVSIIIPFGLSYERAYIKERVLQKASYFQNEKELELIFVEGFSSQICPQIKDFIEEKGHRYLKDESQKNAFSQGACRNLGVKFAKNEVIMVLDVDYHLSKANLKKLLELIKLKDIKNSPNALILPPCLFLNQKANEILATKSEEGLDILLQNDLISGKNDFVKFFAVAAGAFVMNKSKFLELGGYDESFVGHGYEDFDLLARILLHTQQFEKMPKALLYDSRNWDFNEFKGFRALFSLLGYECAFYGIYLYHLWHEEPNQNGYFDNKDKNHKLFFEKLNLYLQNIPKGEKNFYPLNSFIYKPYIYELRQGKFSFFPQNLQNKLSHTKFYRLFRKFKRSPKDFLKDSKNPFLKFVSKMKG